MKENSYKGFMRYTQLILRDNQVKSSLGDSREEFMKVV